MNKQLSIDFVPLFAGKNRHLISASELYEAANQEVLEAFSEDRRIERKPAGFALKQLGEYFSMWSNTAPDGGLLVLGQEDAGEFSGCSRLSSSRINDLERCASVYCPDARAESKRVSVQNSKGEQDFVVVFHVRYRGDRVVETTAGESFTRVGESKTRLTMEQVRELQVEKRQVDHEMERANYLYPDDFDGELIRQFSASFLKTRGLPPQSRRDDEVLEMRFLGRRKGENFDPNMACALVFAKNPREQYPGCKIRFLRFDGETEGFGDKYNAVKDIVAEGPIPIQIAEIERVLDSQLREFARLGKDNKFFVSPEYPKTAWYEALVNACVHRSYMQKNMNVFVKMFDDRLVIESPGGFPFGVTPENIYASHHPRNPHLMDAMFYLSLVRSANEGTRRIRDEMAAMSLPTPEFKEVTSDSGQSVRVILRNNIKVRKAWIDSDVASWVSESIAATLTQDQKRALNHAAEHGSIGVSELARLTNRTWGTAKKHLKKLEQMGILRHVKEAKLDRDPNAKYVLKKKP